MSNYTVRLLLKISDELLVIHLEHHTLWENRARE